MSSEQIVPGDGTAQIGAQVSDSDLQVASQTTMFPDTNSFTENGIIYSPNPVAVIRNGLVYDIDEDAYWDQATNNYYTLNNPDDVNSGYKVLSEVLKDQSNRIFSLDPTSIIRLDASGNKVVYSPNSVAKIDQTSG